MSKYHKGDKFIVEINEVINSDNGTLYRSNFSTLVFNDYGLDSLHQAITPAEDGLVDKSKVGEAYNKGLNDAWELAKKIILLGDRKSIFGYMYLDDIMGNFAPQEALAKLEAYEKEQNEIKVGDVVQYKAKKIVVTRITTNKEIIYGLDEEGYEYGYSVVDVIKTGKHIDIQSVLEQIKE